MPFGSTNSSALAGGMGRRDAERPDHPVNRACRRRHEEHQLRSREEGCQGLQLQPFSQKSRTPTVAKEFQIGLYDPAEADWELFCSSWSAEFFGERLHSVLSPIP